MEIISAVFAGSGISKGFGKICARWNNYLFSGKCANMPPERRIGFRNRNLGRFPLPRGPRNHF
jgi:hypothetical protein